MTETRPQFGKSVSHSHHRANRRFNVNVQRKKYWVPSLGRTIRINVNPRGIRTIDKRGIDIIAQEMMARGEKI